MIRDKKANDDLIPTKSRAVYEKEFKIFVERKLKNVVTTVKETVIMAFRNWYVIFYFFTYYFNS